MESITRDRGAVLDHWRAQVGEHPGLGDCRCWIYGASRDLEAAEVARRLEPFLAGWHAHELPVRGQWTLLEGRFLVVVGDVEGGAISGCSMDALQETVRALEADLGTALLDSSRLFYRDPAGRVQSADRAAFRERCREGAVGPETPVFDTLIQSLGRLLEGPFELPLRDSWHHRLYVNATRPAAAQ